MRKALPALFFALSLYAVKAQKANYDSLKTLLASAKDDSARFVCLGQLFNAYQWSYPDSSLTYVQQSFLLAKKMESDTLLIRVYRNYGWFYILSGDYPQALNSLHECLRLAEKSGNFRTIAGAHDLLAQVYLDEGDYQHAFSYESTARSILDTHWKSEDDSSFLYVSIFHGMAQIYEGLDQLDLALKYSQIVDRLYEKINGKKWSAGSYELGNIYSKKGDYPIAIEYYRAGIAQALEGDNNKDLMDNFNGLAATFKKSNEFDSSIIYANKVLASSQRTNYAIAKLTALKLLADIYESKKKVDSVAKYLQLTVNAKDSLFSWQKTLRIQSMTFNEEQRRQEQIQERQRYKNRLTLYALLGALLIFLVVAITLYRNNQHKQKAYRLLQKQKHQTDIQRATAEQALDELKTAQSLLIQSEKMASLGELTAGIAHEIQNPLNFVNNFSEVNKELIDEMQKEMEKGNFVEAKTISNSVRDNEEKIISHGRRADDIVKSMLQHSRTTSGKKEATDLNAVAEEYLRLAYHGIRAKDKSFNAKFETELDPAVGKINIVPQEIGRVILNLINNAFYAVGEKAKQNLPEYEPIVTVSTKKLSDKIEISVKDNGLGIPASIKDKIFQPFFTTKPTGQGTGLGLSLAYDIVKAHGGEIKVETRENEGTEFTIVLAA